MLKLCSALFVAKLLITLLGGVITVLTLELSLLSAILETGECPGDTVEIVTTLVMTIPSLLVE